MVFDQITASSIRGAALRTKGAAGPSGIDAHVCRRLCTSFKSASNDLCHALTAIAKRLCTTFVNPKGISPLLVCRLIALDKCPGIRPIGVCETPRRIIAKAVLFTTKYDLQDTAGPKQLCAGQIAGIEAAVHAVRSILSHEDTEAILLVDASNAFNSLNRQVALLADIATSQPHATYAAFIHGFTHQFTYLSRTTPNKDHLLEPLEQFIRSKVIPAWTGRAPPNDLERELFALPARLGGLGIVDLVGRSHKEFQASVSISAPLCHLIQSQQSDYPWETMDVQTEAKLNVRKQRREESRSLVSNIKSALSDSLKHAVELAQEKGASTWLTSLPLEEFGFSLHKGAFRDALALRYGWLPSNTPINCPCGTHFSVDHALSCPKGGFPSIPHNEVRDTVADWMSEVCSDVCTEPTLQPITGETLTGTSAISGDGTRLDVAANCFWGGRFERAYFDVRIFNPNAPSNRQQCLASTYIKH